MSSQRPTLVLLHPFPQDASFWDAMRAHLRTPMDVIAPQVPGFGGRELDEDLSLAHVAGEVAEIIMRADAATVVVCGLSMGGYVALALVAEHPHLVDGLILANTRAEADSEEGRAVRDAGIATLRTGGAGPFLDDLMPQLLAPGADPDVVFTARATAEAQPAEALIAAFAALRDRPDRGYVLPTIAVPTAVVQGELDEVIPVASIDRLVAEIPGAERHMVPGVGHLSAVEAPEAFARVVESLVARAASAR